METLFPWLILAVLAMLCPVCLVLFMDNQAQRKALASSQTMVSALRRELAAQDEQMGRLRRAIVLLLPEGARTTSPYRALGGPSAEKIVTARAALVEAQALPRTGDGEPDR